MSGAQERNRMVDRRLLLQVQENQSESSLALKVKLVLSSAISTESLEALEAAEHFLAELKSGSERNVKALGKRWRQAVMINDSVSAPGGWNMCRSAPATGAGGTQHTPSEHVGRGERRTGIWGAEVNGQEDGKRWRCVHACLRVTRRAERGGHAICGNGTVPVTPYRVGLDAGI